MPDAGWFSGTGRRSWEMRGIFSPGWLDSCPLYPQMYWRPRDREREVLVAGMLAEEGAEGIGRVLAGLPEGVRAFGGGRFDPDSPCSGDWTAFGAERFFVPLAEIEREGSRVKFTLNGSLPAESEEAVKCWLANLGQAGSLGEPVVLARHDRPDFERWARAVEGALAIFHEGTLEKAVLARVSEFELLERPAPFALAGRLAAAAPDCYAFCFRPSRGAPAFLGASPERLFRVSRGGLLSEAVAGTRPRSLDTVEDERLGAQLRTMDKEQREHGVVVSALREAFQNLCREFSCDAEPSVMKLARVQHLATEFRGTLREGIGPAGVLDVLHPTPATCGAPRGAARHFLAGAEPFDRGWYAGPVGWIGKEDSEFAVAIRSLLAVDARLLVYAGAGIVQGSDPEREWAELEDKISGTLRALSS